MPTDQEHLLSFGPEVVFHLQIFSQREIFRGSVYADMQDLLDGLPDKLDRPAAQAPGLVFKEPALVSMDQEDVRS